MLRNAFVIYAALTVSMCTGASIQSRDADCLDGSEMNETSIDDQSLLQIHQSTGVGKKKKAGTGSNLLLKWDWDEHGLVYNHLAKAGGKFMKRVLQRIVPGYRYEGEGGHIMPLDRDLRFIVGSVRNPCDYYVSLWAYHAIPERGAMKPFVPHELWARSEHMSTNLNTAEDKSRFKKWLQFVLEGKKTGLETARFVISYDFLSLPEGTQHRFKENGWDFLMNGLVDHMLVEDQTAIQHVADGFDPSSVDCWIKTENIVDDLKKCLHEYEKSEKFVKNEANLVKWSELDGVIKDIGHNPSHHMPCEFYYDDATRAMVMDADQAIFEKFGYDTCCAPHKSKKQAYGDHKKSHASHKAVQQNVQVPSVWDAIIDRMPFGIGLKKIVLLVTGQPAQPDSKAAAKKNLEHDYIGRVVLQLVFGIFYFMLVVSKYPMLEGKQPNEQAKALQNENAVSATFQTSLPNCLLSWCCSGPRAAHTFHSVGVLSFWPSLIAMSLCPCCTLFLTNSCTDLNEKLGGEKQGVFMGLLCACCCSCCLIAQDAQTLDEITGVQTGCCSISSSS